MAKKDKELSSDEMAMLDNIGIGTDNLDHAIAVLRGGSKYFSKQLDKVNALLKRLTDLER